MTIIYILVRMQISLKVQLVKQGKYHKVQLTKVFTKKNTK